LVAREYLEPKLELEQKDLFFDRKSREC